MKRSFVMVILAFVLLVPNLVLAQDYASMTQLRHPRLIMDADRFEELRSRLRAREEKDSVLIMLNDLIMARAERIGLNPDAIEYRFDESGKRLLHRSREAMTRIWLCSYAYKLTGEQRFLDHAAWDMETVCAFPDWNADRHFLDAAEMTAAVAVGYDWLHDELPDSTRSHVFDAMNRFAFLPAADETVAEFYFSEGNWNQVCNAGLVAGAIATYEMSDTTARRIISDAVVSNRRAMKSIYSPDGAYAEGPGYWSYGNIFQALLLSELELALGTDFGLSDTEGFESTPAYRQACCRPGGRMFNYADNKSMDMPAYPMWYFASRFHDPSYVAAEIEFLRNGSYEDPEEVRLLPMLIPYAMSLAATDYTSDASDMYVGRGQAPIVVVKDQAKGNYLGLKCGSPSVSHSHMDGGSFVYDAHGLCWAMDLDRQEYVEVENMARDAGGDFWDMAQSSLRWRFLRMNNLAHNTITVNGHDHAVKGSAVLLSSVDSAGWRGGVMDLTSLYDSQVAAATRKVVISPDGDLIVEDIITALESQDADIRWTMVTPAEVCISSGGIELSQSGIVMSMKTSSDTEVEYREWSLDPKDYSSPFADKEPMATEAHACGFHALIRRGTTAKFTTIFRR